MSTTESPSIAARVAELQAGLGDHLPAEVAATFAGELTRLDQAGIPAGVAGAGAMVPDGDLLDAHGNPTSLADQRHGRPAVVVFYRGAWCPYCNLALRAYQEQLVPTLAERGIELIAVSPQKPDGSLSMAETNELTFTVVSDPGNQIAAALGILTAPTEDARGAQRTLGVDLAAINADGSYGIPMPTVLILDRDGVIRWIDVHPNYTTRTESADILAALTVLS
ncbi:MAG TPA: peroxiredoxin-like family protein [Mycobacterium sp.]|nr:peroxiredoxin-like family protein [Mycobacterium sp.]